MKTVKAWAIVTAGGQIAVDLEGDLRIFGSRAKAKEESDISLDTIIP